MAVSIRDSCRYIRVAANNDDQVHSCILDTFRVGRCRRKLSKPDAKLSSGRLRWALLAKLANLGWEGVAHFEYTGYIPHTVLFPLPRGSTLERNRL